MHELSIAEGILDIIKDEMVKNNVTKLLSVTVVHGKLATVVPEALDMAFTALTIDTPLAGATFTMKEIPIRVRCRQCKIEFSPDEEDIYLMTCPECGCEFGHEILTGKELYIESIEAE
ncbi:MAG: hydrogenase maturation nickel metallochaperone HypA [Desulfoplanes sp.]|jgi:hydrogenase nickel incorporation protein HypA/HybF|nr:hydrogenase maturation nickel metallochaperone HypA [Desulfoplanes sp.]MDD4648994.1 hydrogenase maturation nickel metallochaperone HypA [Desulfoplanes sp.]